MSQEQKQRGRPFGATTKQAKLQRIANRLEQMARTQSMQIIQDSLDGKDVDKEKLSTAKWTVTTAKEFHKACLQEKEMKNAAKEDETPSVEVGDEDEQGGVTFSLVVNK